MSTALDTLDRMTQALTACGQGQLAQSDMIRQWRSGAASLPLPNPFSEVLGNLLDRIEASALFSEESCSFSRTDILAALADWLGKAQAL